MSRHIPITWHVYKVYTHSLTFLIEMPQTLNDTLLQHKIFRLFPSATPSRSSKFVAPSMQYGILHTGTKLTTFCKFQALWPMVLRYNSAALHCNTHFCHQQSLLHIACNNHQHLELYYENTPSKMCTKVFTLLPFLICLFLFSQLTV